MNDLGKSPVQVTSAPQPVGPYSQAIKASGLVFVSGQIALDPATGQMSGADAPSQARLVLKHLQAILEAAGSHLGRVVKTTIYLANLDDFAAVNQVYAEFFSFEPPARACVEVSRLPKGALVEIDAIATCPTASAPAHSEGSMLSF